MTNIEQRLLETANAKVDMLECLGTSLCHDISEMLKQMIEIAATHPDNGKSPQSRVQMSLYALLGHKKAADATTAAIARDFAPVYERYCTSKGIELKSINVTSQLDRSTKLFCRALELEFIFPRWFGRIFQQAGLCYMPTFYYEVVAEGASAGEVRFDWHNLELFDLADMELAFNCFHAADSADDPIVSLQYVN